MTLPTVAYVTAGGAGMYCGSCMRDNTLAATLHRRGVSITLIPTFTPIRTDEEDVSLDRVFLGGINIYLEQKLPICRHLPRVVRRALNHPRLLRALSKLSLQTRSSEDGAIAVSLLRGTEGHHASETVDLAEFVADTVKPDLVNLSNLLISGFVPELKRRHDVPVVITLQGDDVFLDALEPRDREAVLVEMRRSAQRIDGFIVFNRFYRDFMAGLLDVPVERFHVVPLGIAEHEVYHVPRRDPGDTAPTVGYLARICPEKGFHRLVDAFLRLRTLPDMGRARLRVAGWLGASDRNFFARECRRIQDAGAGDALDHVEVGDRPSKVKFLNSLDVLSVPTVYRDPKGIFVLEALAAGVPVVQPNHGAFVELLASTGGGRLVSPGDAAALAHELHGLLVNPAERKRLGDEGRQGVADRHSDVHMANETLEVWSRIVRQY